MPSPEDLRHFAELARDTGLVADQTRDLAAKADELHRQLTAQLTGTGAPTAPRVELTENQRALVHHLKSLGEEAEKRGGTNKLELIGGAMALQKFCESGEVVPDEALLAMTPAVRQLALTGVAVIVLQSVAQ